MHWARLLAPLLTAALALAATAGGCKKPPSEAPEAPEPPSATASGSAYKYLWSMACAGCHPQHHAQWATSLHALAHAEPVYDYYFIRASQDSGKALEPFCGRCHTPLAVRSGAIPFPKPLRQAGDTRVDRIAAEGVQCDFCHTIAGHGRIGNAGYSLAPSDVKRGPLPHPKPVNHRAATAPFYRKAEYCGTCHEVIHPTNGIPLETTYSEWKASPYAKAGIVCQDCHLTDGLQPPVALSPAAIGRPPRHPGKAAIMGPGRPHVSRHFFVGPNQMFVHRAGKQAAAQRALRTAFLQRAGRVAVVGVAREKGAASLTLRVTNTGAGHYLPTGVTELREVFLEVVVKDAAGKVLLHSGARDAAGNLTPGTLHYRTIVHDAKGRDTTLFWNTTRKVRDRRIPPLGSLVERIPLPGSARGKVTVEAALQYRSVSPAGLAEAGVPPGTVTVPIITIHRVSQTLTL